MGLSLEEKAIRWAVIARDGGQCRHPECWITRRDKLSVHHVIPKSMGGPYEEWNLLTLCTGHHALIHGFPAEKPGDAILTNVEYQILTEDIQS